MIDARLTGGFIAVLAGLVAACAATPVSSGVPFGWTAPSEADLKGADEASRRSSETAYLTSSADFDGDGREDVARILVNRDTGKYGVFLFPGGSGTPTKLYEGSLAAVNRVGLNVTPAGSYRPACARGAGPAATCDPKTVQLAAPGLEHFTFEAGARVFYWDGSRYVSADLTD